MTSLYNFLFALVLFFSFFVCFFFWEKIYTYLYEVFSAVTRQVMSTASLSVNSFK